jgi:hypothetical protein
MASVTFGDAVGESNKTLMMQLCREDGMLLKADRPATAIDAQFQAMMFNTWPGDKPRPGEPGGLVTAACDPTNKMQQFVYDEETKVLRLAGGKSDEGLSAGLREGKATGGDDKTSGGESEEPAPAAATEAAARPESAGNDKGESSDDSDGLVE